MTAARTDDDRRELRALANLDVDENVDNVSTNGQGGLRRRKKTKIGSHRTLVCCRIKVKNELKRNVDDVNTLASVS